MAGEGAFRSGNSAGQRIITTPFSKVLIPAGATIDHDKLNKQIKSSFQPIVEQFVGKKKDFQLRSYVAGPLTINVETHVWSNAKTAESGNGLISLLSHRLRVSEEESAWRLLQWFVTHYCKAPCRSWDAFLSDMILNAEGEVQS